MCSFLCCFGALGCASFSFAGILVDHAGVPFCVDPADRQDDAELEVARLHAGLAKNARSVAPGRAGGEGCGGTLHSGAAAWRAAEGWRYQLGESSTG